MYCVDEVPKGPPYMHFWQDGTPCVRIDLVAREKSGPPVVANFSLIAFGGRKKPLGVGKILFKSKNFKKEINYNLPTSGWTYPQAKSLSTGFVTSQTRSADSKTEI